MRAAPAIAGAAVAVGALAAAAPTAEAQRWRRYAEELQGGALLHYELTGLALVDDREAIARAGEPPRADGLVLAGARLRGFVGANASVAYHVGLDFGLGSTVRAGGFAYDVALFPAGVVVRVGETSIAGVGVGVGASGAVGTLDDAVTLPVEAFAELGGGRYRVLARARAAYVAGAPSRQSAAPSAPFADELDATLGLRRGRHYGSHGFPTGNGYFLGVSYRELAGARYVGLTLGYSIDMATPRRWVDADRRAKANKKRWRRRFRPL